MVSAGIVGASGPLGGELLRLLLSHPSFDITYLGASAPGADGQGSAGRAVTEMHPHLQGTQQALRCPVTLDAVTSEQIVSHCELVFLATPPRVSAALAPELLACGLRVFDLSGAFRLRDEAVHARWYPGVQRDQELALCAVYGLPELHRDQLPQAQLIALPGCFATAAILSLLPLSKTLGLPARLIVDAKSGSTGSGASVRAAGMHAVRSGVISPYAPNGHRHAAEIEQAIADLGVTHEDRPPRVGMTACGVDMVRGLSTTVHVLMEDVPSAQDLRHTYYRRYRNERFVRVRREGSATIPLPDPKAVIGSNFCDVGCFIDEDVRHVALIGAIDNMLKGGAGQAVQAANLCYGMPEDAGLLSSPIFPV